MSGLNPYDEGHDLTSETPAKAANRRRMEQEAAEIASIRAARAARTPAQVEADRVAEERRWAADRAALKAARKAARTRRVT